MDMKEYIFEECRMLRDEVLQSMRNRNAILTFGLAVLGVIFRFCPINHDLYKLMI